MKYDLEYNDGGEAFLEGFPRSFNPHLWQTCAWYAWDAGWARAEMLSRQHCAEVEQYGSVGSL